MNSKSQNSLFAHDDTPGRFYRCSAEEISMGRDRKATFRLQLGASGAGMGASLDTVLESVIREGDAFVKWSEGSEPLRNLQLVRKTGGLELPQSLISRTKERFHIDLQRTEDSQLEIWECDEENAPRFPVLRLPLSTVEGSGRKQIRQALRSDISLSLNIKTEGDKASVQISVEPPDSKHLNPVTALTAAAAKVRMTLSRVRALLSPARGLVTPVVRTFIEFRAPQHCPWDHRDVKNEPIYRLGDLFRPAINLQ
jgi:hypothetical protein